MPISTSAASCSATANISGAGYSVSAQVQLKSVLGPRLLNPSTALYVYMDLTAHGATAHGARGLIVVAGGWRKNQCISIQNKSRQRPAAGCALVYIWRFVLPQLATAAACLSWQQQQTSYFQANADMCAAGSCSNSVQSSTPQQAASARSVRARSPGGPFELWPANSPDSA